MKSLFREVAFALLSWLMPFVTSVCIFPLKRSRPALFESLMGITLVGCAVLLGCLYLRRYSGRVVAAGLRIGATWMVANWALDALMFSSGPMKMSFERYVSEIAGAYLMIPIITVGLGFAASTRRLPRGATD